MMPIVVNRIPSIGEMRPHLVGKVFELRGKWGLRTARDMTPIVSHDLLQKYNIGLHSLNRGFYPLQDKFAMPQIKTFVDIIADESQFHSEHFITVAR